MGGGKIPGDRKPRPPNYRIYNCELFSLKNFFILFFKNFFVIIFYLCYLYIVFLCVFSYVFVLWIFVSVYFDEVFTTICVPYSLLFSSFFLVFLVKIVYFFDLKMLVI